MDLAEDEGSLHWLIRLAYAQTCLQDTTLFVAAKCYDSKVSFVWHSPISGSAARYLSTITIVGQTCSQVKVHGRHPKYGVLLQSASYLATHHRTASSWRPGWGTIKDYWTCFLLRKSCRRDRTFYLAHYRVHSLRSIHIQYYSSSNNLYLNRPHFLQSASRP